jgi:hypothetical protein
VERTGTAGNAEVILKHTVYDSSYDSIYKYVWDCITAHAFVEGVCAVFCTCSYTIPSTTWRGPW